MKKLFFLIFLFFVLVFMNTCNIKKTPSEPAYPTNTPAVSGTFTPVFTNTNQETSTVTQIITATFTDTNQETPTATPTITATLTITPTFTPTQIVYRYTFDSDEQGWVIGAPLSVANPASLAFTWAGHNTEIAHIYNGTGSYAIDVNMTTVSAAKRGDISKDFSSSPIDATARTLVVWVEIPADLASVSPPYCFQAFLATSSSSAFSTNITITASGWQQLVFPLPVTAWSSSVEYVGLRMKKTNGTTTPDWAGRIYFDEMQW